MMNSVARVVASLAELAAASEHVVEIGVQRGRQQRFADKRRREDFHGIRDPFEAALADFHRLLGSRPMSLKEPFVEAVEALGAAISVLLICERFGTRPQIDRARQGHMKALSGVAIALVLLPSEQPSDPALATEASPSTDASVADRIIDAGEFLARVRRGKRGRAP